MEKIKMSALGYTLAKGPPPDGKNIKAEAEYNWKKSKCPPRDTPWLKAEAEYNWKKSKCPPGDTPWLHRLVRSPIGMSFQNHVQKIKCPPRVIAVSGHLWLAVLTGLGGVAG